jgi:hypothetical protein
VSKQGVGQLALPLREQRLILRLDAVAAPWSSTTMNFSPLLPITAPRPPRPE